jgi:predicted nucleic acid-binding Zn finger protein
MTQEPHEYAVAQQLAMRSRKSVDLYVVGSLDERIYTVRGSDGGHAYTVDLNKGTCTCPDFVFRMSRIAGGKCKHVIRAESQTIPELAKLERESQQELYRRYEA